MAALTTVLTSSRSKSVNAAQLTEDDFIRFLSLMQVSKVILSPIKGFMEAQSYDSGRTNVKYLLDFLQIQKAAEAEKKRIWEEQTVGLAKDEELKQLRAQLERLEGVPPQRLDKDVQYRGQFDD